MFAGDVEKAQLMMKYTNEDALALKKLCDAGKCYIAAAYTEQYEAQLRNTVQNMEQLRLKHEQETSDGLVEKLEQNYMQQQQVLAQILENAPEQAQNGILNAIENTNRHIEQLVLAYKGEAALEQYQEQISQQTENMGENTKLKIQQRLQASHGQNQNQSDIEPVQTETMQQTNQQSNQQTMQQTSQQTGQQNSQNQGTQQSTTNGSNISDSNNEGNKKHGK